MAEKQNIKHPCLEEPEVDGADTGYQPQENVAMGESASGGEHLERGLKAEECHAFTSSEGSTKAKRSALRLQVKLLRLDECLRKFQQTFDDFSEKDLQYEDNGSVQTLKILLEATQRGYRNVKFVMKRLSTFIIHG